MEYGVVKYTSMNVRGKLYGIIRTPEGEDIYFDRTGETYRIFYTDKGIRFAGSKVRGGPACHSEFPRIGDKMLFARKDKAWGSSAVASTWCRILPTE